MSSERRERRVRETEAKVWRSGPCSGRSLADLISGITQASRHSAHDVGRALRSWRDRTLWLCATSQTRSRRVPSLYFIHVSGDVSGGAAP